MICFPNAKINLGLRITSKRKDRFHNIESVLLPIPFFDVLEFKTAGKFNLKTFGLPIGCKPDENILFKTWELLNKNCSVPPLEIQLLKNIPVQSGLGGGSSNAAFLIRSANDFFKLNLSTKEMQKLAARIGSDCAFFIENKPALAEGRGDKLSEINISLKGCFFVLLMPKTGVSTKEAYTLIKPQKPQKPLREIIQQPIENWIDELKNDFEKITFKSYPRLKELKNDLYRHGAVYASMSGSGSSLFGLFKNQTVLSTSLRKYLVWSGKL